MNSLLFYRSLRDKQCILFLLLVFNVTFDTNKTEKASVHTPRRVLNPGLDESVVHAICDEKKEPEWMRAFRLNALTQFHQMPLPTWGPDLSGLDLSSIHYYVRPDIEPQSSWKNIPESVKNTFDALGIPQAERQFLAGVGAQFDSEIIYKRLKKEWADQGVIFCDISEALEKHPELVKKYFATIIPSRHNKFAALNSAVWSGGSFVYVPRNVHITMPLQAYFRINSAQMGQFERTLIIAEAGSSVHYVEGCSAPKYQKSSLHSAVVEIIAHENAHVRYTTIQNWASNVYNLVTKSAHAYRNARVSWVDGNFGSTVTMKYPSIVLREPGARGEIISIAVARAGQIQDSGGKLIFAAPQTQGTILSKSISKDGGRASYRGLVHMNQKAEQSHCKVQCEALLLDAQSRSDTYPSSNIQTSKAHLEHEASISRISEQQLLYAMSRGLTKQQAITLIVNGFIDSFVQLLPMEYAVEINRLIQLEMEGSIG